MSGNRMLHAMLKVRDVNASLPFFEACGMKVLTFRQRSNGAKTSFVGFGAERDAEHFALELSSSAAAQQEAARSGGLQHLRLSSPQVAQQSPDGVSVERDVEAEPSKVKDPFRSLCLRVSDLGASVRFYTSILGMEEVVPNADFGLARALLRYRCGGAGGPGTALELLEASEASACGPGSLGFDHLAVSTVDVGATYAALLEAGVEVTLPPTAMFGTNITGIKDPDNYLLYFVEEASFKSKSKPT